MLKCSDLYLLRIQLLLITYIEPKIILQYYNLKYE
jgi:hypothetical protein